MNDRSKGFCRRTFLVGAVGATVPVLMRVAAGSWRAGLQPDLRILVDPSDLAWKTRAPDQFRAGFRTSKGDFVIEVHRDWAPFGADRFYSLVRNGFYDDQRFTRVVAGYIVQFGIHGNPKVTAAWKSQTIPDDPARQSNTLGSVAFAMTGPNTRSTQVYINLGDNSRLDSQGFAVFGKVSAGMANVEQIYSGYGENAGGGMRAGKQGPIESGGNEYLQREFPKLDYIIRARILD